MGDYGDEYCNGLANKSIPIFEPNVTLRELAAFLVRSKARLAPPHPGASRGIDRGILLVCDPGCAKYLGDKITHVVGGGVANRKDRAA